MANSGTAPQRRYSAACPGCGAPVEFRAAQSTHAICGYCHSTVVRQGEVLARLGKMGELFDDYSPLQLHTSGVFGQQRFSLIGRLQYRADGATWTEWNVCFDDGRSAWLAEDNGAYVLSSAIDVLVDIPAVGYLRVGARTAINGKTYSVSSVVQATLVCAQGELPRLPPLGQPFAVVELRGEEGALLSIDYAEATPRVTAGSAVLLDALQLSGLKGEAQKEEQGRQFACPQCGAPVTVALQTSKSVTCPQCHSLIDLSAGLGGALKAALQDEPINPLIALGTVGQLQGAPWQVLGFQHRMGVAPGDDEHFGWSEYLLYNRQRGFVFLVDSEEGWSLVRPTTGAPSMARSDAQSASYLGTTYQLKYSYQAETNYVCGEFYWPVYRDQKTFNRDFAAGRKLLSLEQSANELVWSSGEQLASQAVAKAFGLEDKQELLVRQDVAPFSAARNFNVVSIVVALLVLLLLLVLLSRCSRCDPSVEYCGGSGAAARSAGGAWGGYSGGGGHK
ncbi:MAG: DUF4178 domain-containing protein [Rhodoferax sp.]